MARTKGTKNKVTKLAQEKAVELGIDPFEILLLIAGERFEALGYNERTELKVTPEGKEYSEYVLPPYMRMQAARDAVQYLLPKRKSVEFSVTEIPDEVFEKEAERRVHLQILKGEIDRNGNKVG